MIVVGPSGRRVVLPARAGLTYPGYGIAVPRLRFDSWLRDAAVAAGADAIDRHGCDRRCPTRTDPVVLDDGRRLEADVVVGADGATSVVADAAGLVDHGAVLWGFAQRAYVDQDVERPIIVLWDDPRWRGFPGYGWLFPGDGRPANVGLGLGLGPVRTGRRGGRSLRRLLRSSAHARPPHRHRRGPPARWLAEDGHGRHHPAGGRTLLVGDAAGLVNPLQGEGIAPAMTSGHAAADAVLAGPGDAAERYRTHPRRRPGRYASVAAAVHAVSISGSPRRVAGPRSRPHPARSGAGHRRALGAVLERPARRGAARPGDPRRYRRPPALAAWRRGAREPDATWRKASSAATTPRRLSHRAELVDTESTPEPPAARGAVADGSMPVHGGHPELAHKT